MKKMLTIIFLLTSLFSLAQDKKGVDKYISLSLSTSTADDFKIGSYVSLESGICVKNLTLGITLGRGNLACSSYDTERIENYYYEIKSYASMPIGNIKGFIIGGWGKYFNAKHSFIEYGVGFTYSIKKIDLGVSATNWDNIVYLSPGITYNF